MWLLLLLGYVTLLYFLIRPRPLPRIPNDDSSSSPPPSSELVSSASSNDRAGGDPQILQPTKYDVFISFRGEDVRDNFLSIVFHHLNDLKKLAVYKDDVNLHRGVEISPSLLQAIEVSDVYVVILSRNYANSKWCLEEMEKIFQCVERHNRMFIPVTYDMSFNDFYETLPSSSSSSAAARYLQSWGDKLLEGWWGKLIQMLGVDFTVISWRAKLEEIGGRAGLDYTVIRPEMELIKEIIKAVFQAIRDSSELVKLSSNLATRGWFGMESKVEQVEALLRSGEKANWTIGLWGAAGIGKTALADAFFRRFSSRFEASYFFRNFSDSLASGLSLQPFGNLQSGFFSKLLGDDDGGGGTLPYDLVLRRVGRIKALVVIDDVGNDVSNIGPLKDLLNGQYSDMFGPGSVVIMTSTNQQLLKNVCHTVHQVEGLADDEAKRLFCFHAFKGEEDAPAVGYLELVTRAVIYAGGNPQALTLLGAHLYGRDLEFWRVELGYLQNNDPKSVVENIGRRIYEGLSRAEKDLFLDLACFYPYWENKRLSRAGVLKDGRRNHITNLVDKSLIRIDDENCIEVSLVLRDLGRGIVNEEGQIRKRTRLWKSDDVSLLFKNPKGDQPIEGIVLNEDWRPRPTRRPDIAVQADAFDKMENLRFLVLGSSTCNFILPEDGLNSLPTMLRILEWDSFPSKFLPSKFSAENLVTLSLRHSKIEQLWKGDELNVDLGNLKTLNLEGSKNLRNLPDLSTAKRLEGIHLCLCESLLELPTSVLGLPKLETLDLSVCSSLKWENLEDYSNDIREQSNRPSEFLPSLKYFILSQTRIQMVPSFATDLSIQALDCAACTELTEFAVIPSLERLDLTNSLIEEVVELDKLTELKYLNLSQNEQLILLSCDFSKLNSLERITLERCSKLSRLPDSIGTLVNLVSLDLSYIAILEELPSSIGDLKGLSELLLTGCKSLSCLPDTIHKLSNLETLKVNLCNQLGHLPLLPSSLKELDSHGCKSLRTLSTDIVAQAQLTLSASEFTRWCFGWCWKLDPAVCSKIVDKFTEDLVRCPKSSVLLVPAKRVADTSNSEAGSIMGSHDNNVGNNSSATAKLRGQPWKLLSIIFCVLIETPPFENLETSYLECLLNSDDNDVSAEMKRNTIYWLPERKYEAEEEDKEEEENPSNGHHLLLWSAYRYSEMVEAVQRVAEKAVDADGAAVEFSFQGRYCGQEEGLETSILIKNCRVIPVYEDRVVTYEEEEEDDDDGGDDQYRVLNLGGLYDQMCSGQ